MPDGRTRRSRFERLKHLEGPPLDLIGGGHADYGHGDLHHIDIPHADGDHTDEHGDGGHGDVHADSHIDSGHVDDNFFDVHDDAGHVDMHHDVPHADDHADDTHADAPHGDLAHDDEGHADSSHGDEPHDDGEYSDTYGDHVDESGRGPGEAHEDGTDIIDRLERYLDELEDVLVLRELQLGASLSANLRKALTSLASQVVSSEARIAELERRLADGPR